MTNPLPAKAELTGWKMIAAHLGVSVREAQSWEKDDGMPVHRMPGKKSRVWADRTELDTWKQQILARGKPADLVSSASDQPASPAIQGEAGKNTEGESVQRFSRRRLLGGLVGATIAAGSGAAWIISRPISSGPARVEQTGNSLCAWDDIGRLIWKHTFSENLRDVSTDSNLFPHRSIQLVDLLGTGKKQVLFVASVYEDSSGAGSSYHEELCCFSPIGQLLWRYKPAISVTLGDTRFSGPWNITDMLALPGAPSSPVWITLAHRQWRPGILLAISPRGEAAIKFVNSGHLYAVAFIPASHGGHIMVGGVNNEYAAAAVAILGDGASPSSSPQTPGSRFECVGGPKGKPERYFLFPPTELNFADNQPYSKVVLIAGISGQVEITTGEVVGLRSTPLATAIYSLSATAEIDTVAFDDGFAVQHRRFEELGKLHHTLDQCPVLSGPKQVRRWDEKSSWVTLDIPLKRGVRPDSHRG